MKDEPVFEYHAEEALIKITLPDGTNHNINIKSGWSFGTGGHETTRLCIKAIEELFRQSKLNRVLDIGCGSGILSIVSSLLGAEKVKGIDLDSSIVDEARSNALANSHSGLIEFSIESLSDLKDKYHLVTANILLKTIKYIINDISEIVLNDGYLIISGIRKAEVENALDLVESAGFEAKKNYTENDWVAILFKKI